VLPYIKSGGRLPKADNSRYNLQADGGIFQSPLNESAWSTKANDGWPGDETTRFPRSWANNKDAGVNNYADGCNSFSNSPARSTPGATIWEPSTSTAPSFRKSSSTAPQMKPPGDHMKRLRAIVTPYWYPY
jgi:hypothetical protein